MEGIWIHELIYDNSKIYPCWVHENCSLFAGQHANIRNLIKSQHFATQGIRTLKKIPGLGISISMETSIKD